MREVIERELEKSVRRGKAFYYLVDAIELYNDSGDKLNDIYMTVANKYGVSADAVSRSIALAISGSALEEHITPKAFIAQTKERIMFEFDE